MAGGLNDFLYPDFDAEAAFFFVMNRGNTANSAVASGGETLGYAAAFLCL